MKQYRFYTAKDVKPSGWLKRQLLLQAEGLAGNLDRVWPDVRSSAWIGGDREGWERVPYWLDGFIPLAYLLEDDGLIARAKRYIDAILAGQRPDGWICPCAEQDVPAYDTWPVALITKVLAVYYDCSGDPRIPEAVRRAMKNYYDLLSSGKISLFRWAKFRWFEGFVALDFLKSRCDEPWISELAKILKKQGYDYGTEDAKSRFVRPLNKWTFETHVVNLAMMLKYEAVSCGLLGEDYTDKAEELFSLLMKYNGTPAGIFTGDECLSGLSPIQGTELCAVAELMYSFEWLYARTGDAKWAERLELAAFNALPAAISDDMWAHQYDQMSNQISCETFPGRPVFRTNGADSHLFGLEPNYGCCTANFGQAWPKLALSAFLRDGNDVVSAVPVPSVLDADGVRIELTTEYPFRNEMHYQVTAERPFRLILRIPSFAVNATVNGMPAAPGSFAVGIAEHTQTGIDVKFDVLPELTARPWGLYSVKCGSLVFSLPIRYEKKMLEYVRDDVERKYPYCDWEYIGRSEWRYGFAGKEFRTEYHPTADIPFSSEQPAVTLRALMQRVDWEYEDGFDTVCAKTCASPGGFGEPEPVSLWPYGCAKLRMTEMPLTANAGK